MKRASLTGSSGLRLVDCFRATLAPHLFPLDGDEAPLGLHWCLAPDIVATSHLGEDGHPAKGDFLPPIALPRRMWAAGSLEFHASLRLGDHVRRTSTSSDISDKQGRSGTLCFVRV